MADESENQMAFDVFAFAVGEPPSAAERGSFSAS